jgi:hypothetical protein
MSQLSFFLILIINILYNILIIMTGGLLQLSSYGIQDLYLSGNPQMTLFKTNYKRYTNFAVEIMKLPLTGTINFNNTLTCKISSHGDLATKMYLKIIVRGSSSTNGKWAFCKNLGNMLIDNIAFLINGTIVDRQYGEWLNIWNEVFRNPEHERSYNKMVGNTSDYTTLSEDDKEVTLFIPLLFFFNRHNGLALPLIALQHSTLRLDIKLNKSEYCFVNEYEYHNGSDFSPTSVSLTLLSPELYINYVFLDRDERRRFAKYRHEYLIEQVQQSGPVTIPENTTSGTYDLLFNHPCKIIFWNIKRVNLQQGIKYLSQENLETATKRIVLAYADFTSVIPAGTYFTAVDNVSSELKIIIENAYAVSKISSEAKATLDLVSCDKLLTSEQFSDENWIITLGATAVRNTGIINPGNVAFDIVMYQLDNYALYNDFTGDPMKTATIKLNGQDRFSIQNSKYFTYVQDYEIGKSTPKQGLYMYSFALFPYEHQPSGTCNFTKLDTGTLNYTLADNIPESIITAYTINYNVLKIMGGMGSLSYAN